MPCPFIYPIIHIFSMRFSFDHNQPHQIDAIKAVVELFSNLPKYTQKSLALNAEVIENPHAKQIKSPLFFDYVVEDIQRRNGLQIEDLKEDNGAQMSLEDKEKSKKQTPKSWQHYPFSIEMETGTGKTYAYLRTMIELCHRYGFLKFVLIVPSRPIYEGVVQAWKDLSLELRKLYDNIPFTLREFESDNIQDLASFATATTGEVLLMTIHSFNKKTNKIYKESEKLQGDWLPYQYIQATKPIIILDEPQSIDNAQTSREAIRLLQPLFSLRYSATHRQDQKYNMLYRLTPVDASLLGLVKRVSVCGISHTKQEDKQIKLLKVTLGENPSAEIEATIFQPANTQRLTIKQGSELAKLTNNTAWEGYKVQHIDNTLGEEHVYFENGEIATLQTDAKARPAIFRIQIRETIIEHFKRQETVKHLGIKVLSLFFIDKVDNYRGGENQTVNIKKIFEEEYTALAQSSPYFKAFTAQEVQGSYFASYRQKNKNTGKDEEIFINDMDDIKDAKKRNEVEKEQYKLIMRKKRELITFPTEKGGKPVAFIFAHSALKEGWDNPNVFQICTLNQTHSETKKRQEIGRGLRLPVSQDGNRSQDSEVNILTVIANENYAKFVKGLQEEYREDLGKGAPLPKKPTNAKDKGVQLRKQHLENALFQQFWLKLSQDVHYQIKIDTEKIVTECIERLNVLPFPKPQIQTQKGGYNFCRVRIAINESDQSLINTTQSSAMLKASISIVYNNGKNIKFSEPYFVQAGSDNIAKALKDYFLKLNKNTNTDIFDALKVASVSTTLSGAYEDEVIFADTKRATEEYPYEEDFHIVTISESYQTPVYDMNYEIFNLIDRAAQATGLTRKSINEIYQGIFPDKQLEFIQNPEAFAERFIAEIEEILANHIAKNINFNIQNTLSPTELTKKLATLFPETEEKVQQELIEGGANALYNKIQIDSDEERAFVENRLKDNEKVLIYFKFPPKFKIYLPKVIKNYNPDWGILRQNEETGKPILELVRETKGTIDLTKLRFKSEKHKINCAKRFFKAIGIDYRVVTSRNTDWWQSEPVTINQQKII